MIKILAVIGLILSLYALYVKFRSEKDNKYKPICDINKNISCTRSFSSKYGNLAVLPNPSYGVMFYLAVFLFWTINEINFVVFMALFGVIGSIFLSYISYVKQRNFCLVCTGVYAVNFLILFFSLNL